MASRKKEVLTELGRIWEAEVGDIPEQARSLFAVWLPLGVPIILAAMHEAADCDHHKDSEAVLFAMRAKLKAVRKFRALPGNRPLRGA